MSGMTAADLLPVARNRGLVRLDTGAVATLVHVKGSRARVEYVPGIDRPPGGDGHRYTVSTASIVEVVPLTLMELHERGEL